MALATKLQLRQSQSLVMTPQLMQSIRLLQLSHVELERFVDEEMERNPLLERVDQREEALPPEPQQNDADAAADSMWVRDDGAWTAQSMSEQMDSSLENIFPDDPGVSDRLAPDLNAQWKSSGAGALAQSAGDFDMEDLAAAPVTLGDHVAEQIAFLIADPASRLIARELADGLDDAGYLHADPAEIVHRLGVDTEAVSDVLALCQTFEPAGIFGRSLAECLSLQLAALDRLDPAMRTLLANLGLLAKRDFVALRKLCGVDDEDLMDMVAEVRALDPRPGLAFQGGGAESIVPDVEVWPASDGTWTVELNADALPRVLVNNAYVAKVSASSKSQQERDFLSECLQNANWLTRSLDQRARTILKVAGEIVKQQDAFLTHGVRHLRPLTLKAVADAISMHESTVSRVTANKFMLTPRGVFELRYFFSASIASVSGEEAHSSEAVRHRIRSLIAEEQLSNVLSDDAIVEMLKADGIDVARRTIAKYREGMDIPSSVQRRREKRALAGNRA
ncbi:RNA polymerase factor sigma-54 [Arvimicrobium flavum]|uniref:RNA polymerase factor sigma-54 n=1 Tax=Arvimicrobium flavum TaxID=3393320 RepID=UPI00237BD69C|nr:RNA polymerase factor sigma-54 [Mesorhizobium shangrilense]